MHADQHVLGHRHVIEEALVLERAGDAEAGNDVGGEAGDLPAPVIEPNPAGGRRIDAADEVEDRRLAGAVGPDETDDLALVDSQGEIVHGPEAAEVLRQAFSLEKRHPPGSGSPAVTSQ